MTAQDVELNADNILWFADLYTSVFNAPPWHDGWTAPVVVEKFLSFAKHPTFYGLGQQDKAHKALTAPSSNAILPTN